MKSKRPRRPIALLAVIPNTECPSPGPGVRLQRGQYDYRDLHYPGCSRSQHANDDVTITLMMYCIFLDPDNEIDPALV